MIASFVKTDTYKTIIEECNRFLEQNNISLNHIAPNPAEQGVSEEALHAFVLYIVTEFETHQRSTLQKRQKKGIAQAKENGVHFGRSKMGVPPLFFELLPKFNNKEVSEQYCLKKLGCSHTTFFRWKKLYSNGIYPPPKI